MLLFMFDFSNEIAIVKSTFNCSPSLTIKRYFLNVFNMLTLISENSSLYNITASTAP